MKKLFTILAVAATLVSCAKEDVVSQAAPEAIGFDNAFVENSTRSVNDPSFSNTNLFANFGVFGTVEGAKLFDNTTVSGNALNGTWLYEGTQYWITGAKYNFAAVAPQTVKVNDVDTPVYTNASFATTSTGENAEKVYTGTTTLSFENNGTTDLLYAYATAEGKVSGNATVGFTFRHTLSKVKFSFENGYNASNATIKVYDVKIDNAYATATATLGETSTAWANHDGILVLDFGNASDAEATTGVKESAEVAYAYGKTYESLNERFLIPGIAPEETYTVKNAEGNVSSVTANAYKVTFKVDLLVNNTRVKTYNHTAYAQFAPVAGNSYDIKTVINANNIDPQNKQEPIQFTVTEIDGWDTTNEQQTM